VSRRVFSFHEVSCTCELESSCRLPILSVWDTVLTFLISVDFHASYYAEGPQHEFQYEHLIGREINILKSFFFQQC